MKNNYKKLALSIIEQGLYSVVSLVISLFVLNFFSKEVAGEISYVISISVLMAALFGSLVVEPILVERQRKLACAIARQLQQKLCFGLILVCGSGLVFAYFFQMPVVIEWLFCLAVGVYYAVRKNSNILDNQLSVVKASVLYGGLLALFCVAFYWLNRHSQTHTPSVIFVFYCVMTLPVICASLYLTGWKNHTKRVQLVDYIKENKLVFGWNVLLAFFLWFPNNGVYPLVKAALGYASLAELKSYLNLISPILQVNAVYGIFYLSRLAKLSQSACRLQISWQLFYPVLILNFSYLILLYWVGQSAYTAVYHSRFIYSEQTLLATCLLPLLTLVINIPIALLKFSQSYRIITAIFAIAALAGSVIVYQLSRSYQVIGALIAMAWVYLIILILLVLACRIKSKNYAYAHK